MTFAVLGIFILDWVAVAFEWRKIKPATKVIAMVMVALWTLSNVCWSPNAQMILLLLAQLFGLAGDIFLLFKHRWFIAGLGAFLVGHLFYVALIFSDLASSNYLELSIPSPMFPATLALIFLGLILMIVYNLFKREHFLKHRKGRLLWNSLQVYLWILSGLTVLIFFRFLIQPNPTIQNALLPIGGGLFLLSDILLAYDRFVHPISNRQLWGHVTYHLAQFSLAAGFLSILGHT